MSTDFWSPSYRASSSDLTVAISPLGLVELADEEFEVHGPRLNRYSSCWAWYLGHHWSHRREMGEQQITLNYVRTIADYINNFTFGKGVHFRTPEANSAIIPHLLAKVWEGDNDKNKVLWEMGQLAAVTGDCFVKIAYEEPFVDPLGVNHEGRTRIIPINPAHCFPEYHPHDRDRLLRFKLKYRFWGTSPEGTRQVYTFTEILTDDLVEQYVNDELIDSYPNPIGTIPIVHIPNVTISSSPWGQADIWDIISLNREMNEKMTEISDIINYHCVDPKTEALTPNGWKSYTDICVGDDIYTLDPETDEMSWKPVEKLNVFDYDGPMVKWNNRVDALTTPNHRWLAERKVGRPENVRYDRQFVRTSEALEGDPAAADLREGSRLILGGGIPTHVPTQAKYTDEFVETIGWLVTEGWTGTQGTSSNPVTILSQSATHNPTYVADIRRLQGYWKQHGKTFTEQKQRPNGVVCWYIGTELTAELLDTAPNKALTPEFLSALTFRQADTLQRILVDADGTRTPTGREAWFQDDIGRRDGFQMLTAMLTGGRTRSFENNRGNGVVDTYQTNTVEILSTVGKATSVPNPSGTVWCPTVSTGVWFARRNGSTYWTGNSAPVTIITGAKASQLERGAKKVWAGLPKDANVFNLESKGEMAGAMEYLGFIKQAMHEITGVPENALGQTQPISNTSGVALAIQYQPMMNRYYMKKVHFTKGLERVNELIIRTQAVHEPWTLNWNPDESTVPEKDQLLVLDPTDPNTYKTTIHWPSPLPVDELIKLNEEQAKIALGIQSKRGLLRELGEEFPNEKMAEIFEEQRDDALDRGALAMIDAQIASTVMQLTGMVPEDGAQPVAQTAGGENTPAAAPQQQGILPGIEVDAGGSDVMQQLAQRAFGANLAQRRIPNEDE